MSTLLEKFQVGKFTVTKEQTDDGKFIVRMTPGDHPMLSRSGKIIRIKCTEYHFQNWGEAHVRFILQMQEAKNNVVSDLWRRLNAAPHAVYIRFQRLVARHHNGAWIRGLNIHKGKVSFNFE